MTPAERDTWQQADRILAQLLELPRARRAQRLVALAPSPQLQARVGRLLAAHEAPDGMLDRPAPVPADTDAFGGRRFGRWQLEHEIGRGGMAVVYRAHSVEGPPGQDAAVKILTLGALVASGPERFLREQEALLRLRHPYIASLFDAGVAADGTPWLAMARVEGERVDAWCDRNGLDAAACVRLVLQVCEAVAHAHRNLVIHRDIKPSNVLVDADGRVRLLDFGIARFSDSGDEGTRTGLRALTPEYAAPEQFHGAPAATTMDVFGIGALLYRLLAGTAPHGTGGHEARLLPTAPSRVARRRTDARAGARRPTRLPGNDLDAIVLKALASEPEMRYPGVDALADDLKRWLDGLPVHAQPPSLHYRLRKFAARNRLAIAAAAAVVVAVISVAAMSVWQAELADRRAMEAQAQLDYLRSVLDVLAPATEATRELDRHELIAEAARRARAELGARPHLLASVELSLGDIAQRIGDYRLAYDLYDDALRRRRQLHGERGAAYAEALMRLGVVTARIEPPDMALAERRLRRAAELLQDSDADPALRVRALTAHGNQLADLADYQAARGELAKAARLCVGALGAHEYCDRTWAARGMLERRLNNNVQAVIAFGRLLQLRRARYGDAHARTASAYGHIGHALVRTGDFERGLRLLEHAYALHKRTNATLNREGVQLLCDLAEAYLVANRIEEAQSLLEQYLERTRALFGERSTDYAYGLTQVASLHHRSGRYAEAARSYARSQAIYSRLLGPRSSRAGFAMGRRADELGLLGRHAEALPLAQQALAIHRETLGERSVRTAERWSRLGRVHLGMGRADLALAAYERALDIYRQPPASAIKRRHQTLVRSARGVALLMLDRHVDALADARAAMREAAGSDMHMDMFRATTLANAGDVICSVGTAAECTGLRARLRTEAGRPGLGVVARRRLMSAAGIGTGPRAAAR